MTETEYRRRTDVQWRGIRVRARNAIGTSRMLVPIGAILTVERKFSGFSLIADPCPCCGVRVRVTKVEPHNVEVVE
jgi:hypothetical protein